jgi:hypothetical protein
MNLNAAAVDTFRFQILDPLRAVRVFPDTSDHGHLRADARGRDSLVPALAAGNLRELVPADRLAWARQMRRTSDQIRIDAAYHQNTTLLSFF